MLIVDTKNAPGAIGPYSQAYETNGLVITSGQLPVNPADGTMPEGIAAQAEWSCKNVGAILEAAGSGFDKVVKTTCFLADIADFAAFNEVYAKYFTSKPARSCVAVKDLPCARLRPLLSSKPRPASKTDFPGAFAPGKSVLFLPVRSGCFKHLSQKTVWFFSIPPKKFHLHPASKWDIV